MSISKNELIQYYIIENHSFIETLNYFGLEKRKDLVILLKQYKISKDSKTVEKYNKPRHIKSTKEKEQQIYDVLIQKYPDIKYDVLVDERYPYYVDFYIPSEDLFIEYQGYPAHGNYPFIDGDSKSLEESIRLYGKWREIYIKIDVEKYTKALDSKINFIRIYPKSSLEENYKINQNKYKKLINLIYNI